MPNHPRRASNFFDRFTDFYETSDIGTKSKRGDVTSRLRNRYCAIIEAHYPIFNKASCLDLGAHDGRFAFAALDAGATKVAGIEPRAAMREAANSIAEKYGLSDKVVFIDDDMIDALSNTSPKSFDVILVLGVFYHTMHQFKMLQELSRIQPKYVVLDTLTTGEEEWLIRYKLERHDLPGSSIATSENRPRSMVGIPSIGWIDIVCRHPGFAYAEVDWQKLSINSWDGCGDYKNGKRRTYLLWLDKRHGVRSHPFI